MHKLLKIKSMNWKKYSAKLCPKILKITCEFSTDKTMKKYYFWGIIRSYLWKKHARRERIIFKIVIAKDFSEFSREILSLLKEKNYTFEDDVIEQDYFV